MTTTHKVVQFIAGDDWFVNLQLTDQDGVPYDLDSLDEIRFLLHNSDGDQLAIQPAIRFIDAAHGKLQLWFPHEETTDLPGDIYVDWVRIVCDGIVSTLLTGPLQITADPWRAPIAVVETIEETRQSEYDDVVVVLDYRERIARRPANDDEVAAWRASLAERRDKNLWPAPNLSTLEEWRRRRWPLFRLTPARRENWNFRRGREPAR